jgi:hypothetical protein
MCNSKSPLPSGCKKISCSMLMQPEVPTTNNNKHANANQR